MDQEARAKVMIGLAAHVTTETIVQTVIGPYLEYIEEQEDLPAGYRGAIQGYWDDQYDGVQLRERFDAIDGAAAFIRLIIEYDQLHPADPEGDC